VGEPCPVVTETALHVVGQALIHQSGGDETGEIENDRDGEEECQRVERPADKIGQDAELFGTGLRAAMG
jgi:hypothetical protein